MSFRLSGFLHSIGSFVASPKKRKLLQLAAGFSGKTGLEVGGPSSFFKPGQFPIYLFAKRIDGVNFSSQTVWEGALTEGQAYQYFGKKRGRQYIAEATDLSVIETGTYDFVLSCHSLEHVANPLRALFEWKRVLKPGGALVLVLPDRDFTFDKLRPYTDFKHLMQDYQNGTGEDDVTHIEEIIRAIPPELDDHEHIAEVLQQNYTLRCAHHHVFHPSVVKEMLIHCGFVVSHQQTLSPFHLITMAYLPSENLVAAE